MAKEPKESEPKGLIKEFRKGSTVIIVLKMLNEEPMYGYQIATELEKRSEGYFEFKQGTLYPALHQLEEKKMIEGRWGNEETEGPRRKYYYITDEGRKSLKILTEDWRTFTTKLGSLL
jgi:PadR family transcriptional regulator PadR